jgi:hypothetical protein
MCEAVKPPKGNNQPHCEERSDEAIRSIDKDTG